MEIKDKKKVKTKKNKKRNNKLIGFGVIVVLAIILAVSFSFLISSKTKPTKVLVAKENITQRTEITEEMLEEVEVPSVYLDTQEVYHSKDDIVGKVVNINNSIPKGSMVYKTAVVNKDAITDAGVLGLGSDEVLLTIPVDMTTTNANSLIDGMNVDLYFKASGREIELMFGKLIENAKIIAIKDANGKDVLADPNNPGVPAYALFGVKQDVFETINKATSLGTITITPNTESYKTDKETKIVTGDVLSYIESNSK